MKNSKNLSKKESLASLKERHYRDFSYFDSYN